MQGRDGSLQALSPTLGKRALPSQQAGAHLVTILASTGYHGATGPQPPPTIRMDGLGLGHQLRPLASSCVTTLGVSTGKRNAATFPAEVLAYVYMRLCSLLREGNERELVSQGTAQSWSRNLE